MKDNKNNNVNNVPSIHSGCSLAETGWNDYDDFDNPLGELKIIPKEKEGLLVRNVEAYKVDGEYHKEVSYILPSDIQNPSSILEKATVTVAVPSGIHPITFLIGKGIDISEAWVFLHEDVVDVLRKLPCRYHQNTVARGEFFRFEDFTEISLQNVEYFPKWKAIFETKIKGGTIFSPWVPGFIIEVVMEK